VGTGIFGQKGHGHTILKTSQKGHGHGHGHVILKTSQKGHGHFRATWARARARDFENRVALSALFASTLLNFLVGQKDMY
jgi:hypothetical protein